MGELDDVATGLRKILNSHGHAFQEAVARFCYLHQLTSPWEFLQSECPVELNGKPMHIDFILQNRTTGALIVAECKRADPAIARWCFAMRMFNRAGEPPGPTHPIISMVVWVKSSGRLEEYPALFSPGHPYHLLFETRTGKPGEGTTSVSNRGDSAIIQAFRGVGGLMERYRDTGQRELKIDWPVAIYPVVFTTAELYVTDADLSAADLATGDLTEVRVAPVPWVWHQENLSRELRPQRVFVASASEEKTLEHSVQLRHTRAASVVNVKSIPSFLAELAGSTVSLTRL